MMEGQKVPVDDFGQRPDEPIPLQPVPQSEPSSGGHFTKNLLLVAGAGLVSYLLVSSNAQPCRGSTRSSKLRWQQQQEEMARAECEANAEDDSSK